MYSMFGFLAPILGVLLRALYAFLLNYGWAIILFTLVIRVILFPLALRQQKSTSRMSAYQPMIQEIQKKWAQDRNRMNQEMQKFYEENNVKMTGGCLPMIVNLIVIFGVIALIQAPLQYVVQMPEDQISNATVIAENYLGEGELSGNQYTLQSRLVGMMKYDPQMFIDGVKTTGDDGKETMVAVNEEWVNSVIEFDFNFLGLNLATAPTLTFNINLILPILSVLTMVLSQIIIMKFSGTGTGAMQGKVSMWIMTLVMGVFFAFFAFRIPIGFSLYYTASNIVMTVQAVIVRKIYDPAKIRAEIEIEIEEKKKAKANAKKRKKEPAVILEQSEDGSGTKETVIYLDTDIDDSDKARLERARQLDAIKYSNKPVKVIEEPEAEDVSDATENIVADAIKDKAKAANEPGSEKKEPDKAENKTEYKPGRRRRSSQKKNENAMGEDGPSFAEEEMRAENNQ